MTGRELVRLYSQYLEHSYRYYVLDHPVIPDAEYDKICKVLHDNWDELVHPAKDLTDKSALFAGSGFHLTGKYPKQIECICYMHPDKAFLEVMNDNSRGRTGVSNRHTEREDRGPQAVSSSSEVFEDARRRAVE